jgi:hypothetical protein
MTAVRTAGFNRRAMTPTQKAAVAVAAVFLLVGVLGFIPGVTAHYTVMEFASHGSDAQLFDIFQVSILHNLVHIAFGVAGLLAARSWSGARWFLIGGGVIYLVLWLYGLAVGPNDDANFIPVNVADDWLHFILGAGMVALGVLLPKLAEQRRTSPAVRG